MRSPSDTIPPPRAWADKRPDALERLNAAKEKLSARAVELSMPTENLLTPSILRELAWAPPSTVTVVSVSAGLKKLGARPWQIAETCALISNAFVEADQKLNLEPQESS
jgi:ribonuclease D